MQGYLVKDMAEKGTYLWTIIQADCAHNAAEQHVLNFQPTPDDPTTVYRIAVKDTVLGEPTMYTVKVVWHMEIMSEGEQDPNAGRGLPPVEGGDNAADHH